MEPRRLQEIVRELADSLSSSVEGRNVTSVSLRVAWSPDEAGPMGHAEVIERI